MGRAQVQISTVLDVFLFFFAFDGFSWDLTGVGPVFRGDLTGLISTVFTERKLAIGWGG